MESVYNMNEFERSLENILSPREMMKQLQQQRLPTLRKLAEGKPVQSSLQKTFLLELLVDFYCRRNTESVNRELTDILYRSFELPPSPIDFDCGLTIEKTIIECVAIRIRDLPCANIDYAVYTCGLVDRYMSTMLIENQLRSDRYSAYMELIQESVDRVKYYIRKRIHENLEQPENMIDDIEYTDAESDEESNNKSESIEINVSLLVSPSKLLKQQAHCPICMDPHPKKQMLTTDCCHWFCCPCFSGFLRNADSGSRPVCPLCRKLIFQIAAPTPKIYRDLGFYLFHCEETPTDTPEV